MFARVFAFIALLAVAVAFAPSSKWVRASSKIQMADLSVQAFFGVNGAFGKFVSSSNTVASAPAPKKAAPAPVKKAAPAPAKKAAPAPVKKAAPAAKPAAKKGPAAGAKKPLFSGPKK